MIRIAILNTTHFANKGSMGRIEGMINCLNETFPQCAITIFHRHYHNGKESLSMELMEQYPNLEIKDHPWFRESKSNALTALTSAIRFIFSTLYCSMIYGLNLPINKPLQQYDVIVDLNFIEPDRLTDQYDWTSFAGNFFALLNVLYATITDKPVVVSSATIGPYDNRILRQAAKWILNKSDLITLREEYSLGYLHNIGVDKPKIWLTADLAFLMEPPNTKRVISRLKDIGVSIGDKSLIGIVPTAMFHSLLPESKYIQLMAELSSYMLKNFNTNIIYLSNTYQDVVISEKIYNIIDNKKNTWIIPFEFSASDTKGFIGICDLFICSRFHALVASTSLGVPSLGMVAYSRNKFHGIIGKMMAQDEYLLDVDEGFEYNSFLSTLESKASTLLKNKVKISSELKEQSKIIQEKALLNGRLIKELLNYNVEK